MEIQPDLSIALVSENNDEQAACLAAIQACCDPLSVQIFVAESTDGWHQWQQELTISVITGPRHHFIGTAWQQAEGRYLASWHSAVIPAPACLFSLVEFLDDHPDVAVAGPRFFSPQGDILASVFKSSHPLVWRHRPPLGWDGLSSQEVGWLSGRALLCNREAMNDIGPPGDNRPGWERRYCRRLRRHGWHIFFCHLARVSTSQPFP